MRKVISKLLLITIAISVTCGLSACGTNLVTFVTEDFPTQVMNRAEENKNAIQMLNNCGLISDEMCNSTKKMIDENARNICVTAADSAASESIDNKNLEHMAKAFVWLKGRGAFSASEQEGHVYYGEDEYLISSLKASGNKDKTDRFNPANYFVSDYLMTYYSYYTGRSGEVENKGVGDNNKKYFSPVEFLDDDTIDTLNNLGNVQVYVINTGMGGDLATNIAEIQNVFNTGTKQEIAETLGKKFVGLVDSNGDPIYALTEGFEIAGYSREGGEGLGYLMDVEQCGVLIGKLSFKEIYKDEFDAFNELISADRGMYYFCKDDKTNGWKAYLLEYPVNVLESVIKRDNETAYDLRFCNSDTIKVNIKTGKIVVLDENGEWKDSNDNCFIKLDCNNSNSSLVVNGTTYTDTLEEFGKDGSKMTKLKVKIPAVYLRDYLEFSYAPGYNENDLVAFGRRLRVDEGIILGNNLSNDDEKKFTTYGKKYVTTFYVKDDKTKIMDYIDGQGEPDMKYQPVTVADLVYLSKEDEHTVAYMFNDNYESEYKYRSENSEGVKSITDLETIMNPEKAYGDEFNRLRVVREFIYGSNDSSETYTRLKDYKIDSQDTIASTGMQAYGVVTRWGIFDNGTFSWLQSTELESGVNWWNSYLEENNLNYRINKETLSEYLNYNFAYELGLNGVVIYDIATLTEIQKMYDKETLKENNSLIKTGFFIFGLLLVIYAFILIIFWIVDVHIALPVKLYNKATFGVLDAVEEIDETMESEAKKYVDMKGAIIISFITAVIGVVLMSVSVLKIARAILEIIRAFTDGIQKIF